MQQSIVLSFVISEVPGLIDVTTQPALQRAAHEYLESYVTQFGLSRTQRFVVDSVQMKSQETLGTRRLSKRNVRQLADINSLISLRVALQLHGFTVAMSQQSLTSWLVQAIDSNGFTAALQKSHPFYSRAVVASAVDEFPDNEKQTAEGNGGDSNSTSTATAIISILSVITILIVALGAFSLRHKYKPPCLRSRSEEPELPSFYSGFGQKVSNMLSFDSTSTATNFRGSIVRIGSPSSQSKDSNAVGGTQSIKSLLHNVSEDDTAETEEHPFAGFIPPMIVIDNIDGEHDESINYREAKKGRGVPVKRVDASSSLAAALNTTEKPTTPTLSEMFS